ncbi:MAG: GTPase HflX, partial [Alphaproteobacteria bacterium]|nr:GTPase HflX [Alphaproteobacteria bacterium]
MSKTPPGRVSNQVASRSTGARLDEAVGLARAIRLDVIRAEVASVSRPRPSSFLGSGTVENFAELISEYEIG